MNKRKFTTKDFNSDEGMLTSVWGPALWHVLHTISFNYPVNPTQKQKKDYKRFILSLEHVLPCKYCRINFKTNCKDAKICNSVFDNRKSFSKFIYRLHCSVNKALLKNKCDSYSVVRNRYEHFRSRCNNKKTPSKSSRKPMKEHGCVKPMHGHGLKCVVDIVPKKSTRKSFSLYKPIR